MIKSFPPSVELPPLAWRWGVDPMWGVLRGAAWSWGSSTMWEPLWQVANTPIKCEIARLAPAHT